MAAYTGVAGAAAYSIPDSTQPGSSTTYTSLRQMSVTDPNSHTTTTLENVTCGVAGTSDSGCYVQSTVQDAKGNEAATFTGGLGKTNYKQTYTGNSPSTYTRYALTTFAYNASGDLLSTTSPDGSVATTTYDALGNAISQSDPDKGTTTATYDPNGNVTQTVDARASAGTIYAGYDGLNRVLWRNSTNSASGAWVNYSYDSTANGNDGIGQLTGESFSGSGNLSGSYAYTYDGRGQQTGDVTTINGTGYPTQTTYNDAGQPLTETYPTGETVTPGYSSTGWLTGLATSAGGTTTLASNLSYGGLAGAAGQITSMNEGNGIYSYNASYDTGIRMTSTSLSVASSNTLRYQTQPTYDAVSNVIGVQTSIAGQTDTQQFCYDDLNRLTWSGTNGTPPCSGASISAGTLTGAQYQQSDAYNVDGGLTSGPKGSYTYGDSSHPHAVTAADGGYSASYDASGNMTCRATSSAATCSGASPTGQQLSYDPEGRLTSWQNQANVPSQIVNYLYDGEGHRVAMQSNVSGTSTLTSYIGSIEEVQTSGSTTQTSTFYSVGSKRMAADVNGTFYYFGYDALGSQVAVLDGSGNLVGAQLYGPYGASRYTTGTIPTSIGFTGQQSDSVTGLDYYGARYYDALVGVFISADDVQGNRQGMEPYAYVGGNPETLVDPTGNDWQQALGATLLVGLGLLAIGVFVGLTGGVGLVAAPFLVSTGLGILTGVAGPAIGYGMTHNGQFEPSDEKDKENLAAQETIGGITGGLFGLAGAGVAAGLAPGGLSASLDAANATLGGSVRTMVGGFIGAGLNFAGAISAGWASNKYPVSSVSPSKHASRRASAPMTHSNPKIVIGLRAKAKPASKPTPVPKRTYTHTSTRSYSSWEQTSSGYNSYTQSNYSYSDTVYHYANPIYDYSVFSASNGYYERSSGGMHMS